MTFERLDALENGYIEADLKNTEDKKKVLSALDNIFPIHVFSEKEDTIVGEAELAKFRELAEKENIRAAIEAVLDSNLAGETSHIDLNKTAALAGRIGLDEESPIGKIRLRVPWKKA